MTTEKSFSVSLRVQDDIPSNENVPSLVGLPLAPLTPYMRFTVCSVAIFVFYLLYGYMLELVFRIEGIRDHGWFVTLLQFCYYSLFALVQLVVSRQSVKTSVSMRTYAVIAILTVGTMGFSNTSMGYLNYPTQVIFKSCKLIPVMIGSVIILKKRYSFAQVLACVTMCVGLVWFTLADSKLQPNFSMQGVVLVSLSLCCDAVIGNVQEVALKSNREPTARLVLYSYGIGLCVILLLLVLSGSFMPGVVFLLTHWWQLAPPVLVLSASGFCGVQAVLALVALYGALAAVTVTTARKALSILLSFLLFAKPFTVQYVWGGLLVCLGIYLSVLAKEQDRVVVLLLNKAFDQLASNSNDCAAKQVRRMTALLGKVKAIVKHSVITKPLRQFKFDV